MTNVEKKVLELLEDADFVERVEDAIREAYARAAESANCEFATRGAYPGLNFAVNIYPDGEIVVRAGVLADAHDGKCVVIVRAQLCVERDEPFEEGYFPEDIVPGDLVRDFIQSR